MAVAWGVTNDVTVHTPPGRHCNKARNLVAEKAADSTRKAGVEVGKDSELEPLPSSNR
jgi:hypothetical protein